MNLVITGADTSRTPHWTAVFAPGVEGKRIVSAHVCADTHDPYEMWQDVSWMFENRIGKDINAIMQRPGVDFSGMKILLHLGV